MSEWNPDPMHYSTGQILFGKYRIDTMVGRGAFAEVYRATHLALDVQRALKVLRQDAPGVGSTEYTGHKQRFATEAQLGAQLSHPHVIRVYDFEEEKGILFLTMEYAAGGSLADRLHTAREQSIPLSESEVLRFAREAASGLAALHNLDVVHRDIKPSNLLFDAQGCTKLADLGLAQIPSSSSSRGLNSNPPAHPGTPQYMSPEQKTTRGHLTPASDVYALGAVLFEMLTGRVYHNLRPGTAPRDLRPDVSSTMNEIVLQCLRPTPEDRPWDGAELLKLLSEEYSPGPRHDNVRWLWGLSALAALGILGLLLGRTGPYADRAISVETVSNVTSSSHSTATQPEKVTPLPSSETHSRNELPDTVTPTLPPTPLASPTPLVVKVTTSETAAPATPANIATAPTQVQTSAPQPVVFDLIQPAQGSQSKNPVSFQWRGTLTAGQRYLIEAWHVESAHLVSATTQSSSYQADMPAEKYGAWRWHVKIIGNNGAALSTSPDWEFWFNPVPGVSAETPPTLAAPPPEPAYPAYP